MTALPWLIVAFLSGSIPFSVWIGRFWLHEDIRSYGDANPGATNVLRAGGKGIGLFVLLLDGFKGAIPVGLAYSWAHLEGWDLIVVALMPVLGHAFSPFLHFRGGKAVAVTGGIWAGLTAWEGPTVFGLGLGLSILFIEADGWAVMAAMLILMGYFMITPETWNGLIVRPDLAVLGAIWAGNLAILIWKHRSDLSHPPIVRGWLQRMRADR